MGNPVNPRARGGASLSGELRASRADREQIRRLLSTPPKPKPAPVASGLPILGMASVTAVGSSILAGSNEISYNSIEYGAPSDPSAWTGGLAPSSWCSTDGYAVTVTEGWYTITVLFDVAWSDSSVAPNAFGLYVFAGYDIPHQENSVHPAVTINSRKGVRQPVNGGPTYVKDPMYVQLQYPFTPAASGAGLSRLWGGGSVGQINWTIVKHT